MLHPKAASCSPIEGTYLDAALPSSPRTSTTSGGALSYYAGVRLGAVETHAVPALTYAALAAQYAVVMPLMMYFAPGAASRRALRAASDIESARNPAPSAEVPA